MADQLICSIDIGSSKFTTLVATFDEKKEDVRIIGYDKVNSSGVKKRIGG